ncbi:MAG: DNA repair protein RecN [Syntrophomonadaceae bacterium]|jgi:DNA repair protein RecN (Recombination protein N)|nr:DNA repair protein RecN [Thermoanaerobacterales bacterium]NLN20905.1 DNA repair protein RecN [Syntrophomonadaceae bacterium]
MLIQLLIRDFALIESVELMFGPQLNVLTGETGAGKSIIVDAVNLLVGMRASSDLVRNGAEKAQVEGLFDYSCCPWVEEKLVSMGLPVSDDHTLLLTREISVEGRSVCRVNGRAVPLNMYRPFGEYLVDLHGQHEHQSLLRVSEHRELVDRYCGAQVLKQRQVVAELYKRLMELKKEQEQQQLSENEMERRLDYLRFALEEIDQINPVPGEEEQLREERERLRYGEKLAVFVQEAIEQLSDGNGIPPAYDQVGEAAAKIREIARIDKSVEELASSIEDVLYRLEDIISKLRSYREQLNFDPDHARNIEERLFALRDLMRKYGASLKEVCAFREEAAAEMERLEGAAQQKEQLEAEYKETLKRYEEEAGKLSSMRREGVLSLTEAVAGELCTLGLENARLEVGFSRSAEPTAAGYDILEFLFSANPGEPLKSLSKIASGGEMSRVMLALKVVLAENDQIPTLIFDEIDAGIGGLTVQAVAERLYYAAQNKQVICVTHAPHIAGRAQTHFYISKSAAGGKTRIKVQQLQSDHRVAEIVRMLGGTADEEAILNHARQILKY